MPSSTPPNAARPTLAYIASHAEVQAESFTPLRMLFERREVIALLVYAIVSQHAAFLPQTENWKPIKDA